MHLLKIPGVINNSRQEKVLVKLYPSPQYATRLILGPDQTKWLRSWIQINLLPPHVQQSRDPDPGQDSISPELEHLKWLVRPVAMV